VVGEALVGCFVQKAGTARRAERFPKGGQEVSGRGGSGTASVKGHGRSVERGVCRREKTGITRWTFGGPGTTSEERDSRPGTIKEGRD